MTVYEFSVLSDNSSCLTDNAFSDRLLILSITPFRPFRAGSVTAHLCKEKENCVIWLTRLEILMYTKGKLTHLKHSLIPTSLSHITSIR